MKIIVKYLAGVALAAGLMLPTMSFAGAASSPETMTATMPQEMGEMMKVQLHYKDAQGGMKTTNAYVPKSKVDELRKAKKVELTSCPNAAACIKF